MFTLGIVTVTSYLLGSVPAGFLAGRIAGVDIRRLGSGNVGATNVLRVLGKRFGYPVFLVDFGKGFAAVELALLLSRRSGGDASFVDSCAAIAAIFAVVGHTFPVWLRFKGGKGVATSIGVLFGLAPIPALIVCGVWLLTFEISRYVSLASIVAALAFPATVAMMSFFQPRHSPVLFYISLCLAGLVIARHRANLVRLSHGTEPRFRRK